MAADDLLVVGLDLDTGRHVHIEDRPMDQWRTLDVLARYGVHISIRTADGWVDCLDQPCAAPQPAPAEPAHTPAAPWPHAA